MSGVLVAIMDESQMAVKTSSTTMKRLSPDGSVLVMPPVFKAVVLSFTPVLSTTLANPPPLVDNTHFMVT